VPRLHYAAVLSAGNNVEGQLGFGSTAAYGEFNSAGPALFQGGMGQTIQKVATAGQAGSAPGPGSTCFLTTAKNDSTGGDLYCFGA
jgi:hypothetical protein